jgi:hypothetical protein
MKKICPFMMADCKEDKCELWLCIILTPDSRDTKVSGCAFRINAIKNAESFIPTLEGEPYKKSE